MTDVATLWLAVAQLEPLIWATEVAVQCSDAPAGSFSDEAADPCSTWVAGQRIGGRIECDARVP